MTVEQYIRPSFLRLLGEGLLMKRWLAGRSSYTKIAARWPGHGQKVMVVPGLLSNDGSTALLRRTLSLAGYESHGWQLGYNMPAKSDLLDRLNQQIGVLGKGQPLALIGWSFGGIIARAYAHQFPDRVSLVITLGAPFSGSPRDNNAWRLYELIADHTVDQPPITANYATKPPVPTVAIWSSQDGIVSPHSARGLESESDCTVEISCGHFSMSCAPDAMEAVLRVLATKS